MYTFFISILFFYCFSLYYFFVFNILKKYCYTKYIFSDIDKNIVDTIKIIYNENQICFKNKNSIFFTKIEYSINKFFNFFSSQKLFFFDKNFNINFFSRKEFFFDKIIYSWNKEYAWYFIDYKILIFMFIISFFLSFIIFILSNFVGNSTTLYFERAKLSVYECGFQPFERIDKCQIFIFYRLAIFFVIFEAELIFLYPWTLNICELSIYSIEYFYNAFFFIFILFFGFFYEIKNKALDF
jgi:NADH:ubiquinone oxidoreductase subunit 3 (subunit A)